VRTQPEHQLLAGRQAYPARQSGSNTQLPWQLQALLADRRAQAAPDATPDEVKALWPLVKLGDGVDTPRIVGALYHPDDGHIAPVNLTMAFRKGARMRGAEIYEQTCVLGVQQHGNSEWTVRTDKGDIRCEHVVCASGNYARETGRMFGLSVPAIPVEHQYIVYDKSPELEAYRGSGGQELAVLRESDQSYDLREERMGWILGSYERGAPARFADGVPHWFGKSLFDGDLDRLLPHVEAAMRRVPALEHCGLKTIVNGPISYTPDGSPLIGPAWRLRNVWLNEGHSFGVTAAGGAGWQLAEWIVEGEPTVDMLAVDPRRYGPYTSKRYTVAKNEEAYREVFTVHFPDEERHDGRPAKTSPVYDKLAQIGTVFGRRYGWERANWFAPPGVERKDVWSFRRTNYFEHVGNECRNMRERAGVIDLGSFASSMSMQSGAPTFGTPEPALLLYTMAALARRLGVPFRSGGGLCASKIADAQAAYESAATLLPTCLAGVNFALHTAGWLEGGLSMGYEKFVMDADQAGMMHTLLVGVDLSENGQAMDAIREVGPGKHFLGCNHTQRNFENAFYRSPLMDNNSVEQWEAEGAKDMAQRANTRWKAMLAEYEPPPLSAAADEAVVDYMDRRRASFADSNV
jgi:glycine/D-amino acid oxidase-like deaminating enzyme